MDAVANCFCVLLLIATLTSGYHLFDNGVEPVTEVFIEGVDFPDDSPILKRQQNLWFGPRLGRKKRTIEEIAIDKNPMQEDTIVELIKDSPWALIPLKGSNRNSMSFTPRLGRESGEEGLTDHSRSPPFAPRLGRRRKLLPFSPRLGRELVSEPSERFARSLTPHTHNNIH